MTEVRRAAGLVLGIAVVVAVGVGAQSTLASLGVREEAARGQVVDALGSGYVPFYMAAKAFKAAAPTSRAALVTGALSWVKAYTETPAFKTAYDKRRQEDAPTAPSAKGSVDDELAKQRAERLKGLEEMKANVKKMPPEMQAQMAEAVKQMEAQIAQMDKDPQMAAMMRQGAQMQREGEQKDYQARVAAHEKRFPADPKALIARRLREFLQVSQTVDYTAKLVPSSGGKMAFANPKYEGQTAEWKLCYRAGKEAVDAARAFASDWLKQLETR
jgi:hypothetical protein